MERFNNISSESVARATGHSWAEWIQLLDVAKAYEMDHAAIVKLVHDQYLPRPWWAQMVTVGYEQAKGLRAPNQAKAGFQVSVTKSFEAPIEKIYHAWDKRLGEWYSGPQFNVTTNNQNKNIRATLADDSRFEVRFMATKTGKTQLTIDHTKLANATAAEAARAMWRAQLAQLAGIL